MPNTIQIELFCYTKHTVVSWSEALCLQFKRSMAKHDRVLYYCRIEISEIGWQNKSEQCAATAEKAWGCWVASAADEGIIPLYSALIRPHLEPKLLCFSTHCTKILWTGWRGSREGSQRWSKDWEAAICGKAERTMFVYPWEKKA